MKTLVNFTPFVVLGIISFFAVFLLEESAPQYLIATFGTIGVACATFIYQEQWVESDWDLIYWGKLLVPIGTALLWYGTLLTAQSFGELLVYSLVLSILISVVSWLYLVYRLVDQAIYEVNYIIWKRRVSRKVQEEEIAFNTLQIERRSSGNSIFFVLKYKGKTAPLPKDVVLQLGLLDER